LTVLLAASMTAWLVAEQAASAQNVAPTLRVRAADPFSVRGAHFHPFERVRLTLNGTLGKRVNADSRGRFVATFRGVTIDVCDGFVLEAVGSRGSTAHLHAPARECASRNPG
jgi:hypothetical protein